MQEVQPLTVLLGAGVASALLFVACGGGNETIEVTSGTVLLNATVVNTRDGSLSQPMPIIVDAGKIQQITPNRAIKFSGTAQSNIVAGKFVAPGYNDMHAHVIDGADQPTNWPLLIANGVTGMREMSGSDASLQRAHRLNADRAAGLVDAPEILMIQGGAPSGPPTMAAAGVQFVQQRKASGADSIKNTAGNGPFVLAVLDEAKKQGIGVAGDLVTAVSALDSSNAGWRAIEHLGSAGAC